MNKTTFSSLPLLTCLLLLVACGNAELALSAIPTWTTVPVQASHTEPVKSIQDTPSAISTSTVSEPTEIGIVNNRYASQVCPFSFNLTEGWSVQEYGAGESGAFSMDVPAIEFTRNPYQLRLNCTTLGDDVFIGPGGLPAGESVSLPTFEFLDAHIDAQAIVWEGDIISVVYAYRTENLILFATIGYSTDPSNTLSYEEFSIDQETIDDVANLLMSFSLTEDITVMVTPPVDLDPLVVLSMEEYYYSQIADTTIPNACGPTAGLIVLDYMGLEDSIMRVIDFLMSVEPEQGGFDPDCRRNLVCTSPMTLAQQLSYRYGITVHTRQYWTLESVYDALVNGHPIIADILWRLDGSSLGHFVVIFGVDTVKEHVYFHDPLEGAMMASTWEAFSARWAGPVDVGDPTYPQGFQYWGMEVFPPQ